MVFGIYAAKVENNYQISIDNYQLFCIFGFAELIFRSEMKRK